MIRSHAPTVFAIRARSLVRPRYAELATTALGPSVLRPLRTVEEAICSIASGGLADWLAECISSRGTVQGDPGQDRGGAESRRRGEVLTLTLTLILIGGGQKEARGHVGGRV